MHALSGSARWTSPLVSGRYTCFYAGRACGGERWEIRHTGEGFVITGEQEIEPPHPHPSRLEYRATLSPEWRATGLDVIWTVGGKRLVALHRAAERVWRVRIDWGGRTREQQGDFPDSCEVEFASHLSSTVLLARRDFQVGGEHDVPALRIGPPFMAVTPGRLVYRCVERGVFSAPFGPREAKRYVVHAPAEGEASGYTFWADEDGFVLESYEGTDVSRPWMRLEELRIGAR